MHCETVTIFYYFGSVNLIKLKFNNQIIKRSIIFAQKHAL